MRHNAAKAQLPLWQRVGEGLGFHVPMLAFALRTSVAAFAALLVAYLLGLEHPHWAAMSAWASSQPLREHLLSRGLYRFGGSVVGVAFAVALVLLAQDSLWILAIGLAAWGALCAYLGNVQRGYMVYGWMLAGYSAVMVVLLHHGPAEAIWPFAGDRLLTVVTGVLAALCISWCFAPRRKAQVMVGQSRQAMAQVLETALLRLRDPAASTQARNLPLLSQLAQVEELLELYPEGSQTAHRTTQAMLWQQRQAMEVAYQLASMERDGVVDAAALPAPAIHALEAVVVQLKADPRTDEEGLARATKFAQSAIAQSSTTPLVASVAALLVAISDGLHAEQRDLGMKVSAAAPLGNVPVWPLHRDKLGARQAAIRAGGTMLVVGALWAWTGSSTIAFGLLGLSVMLLVFSSFESPSRTMAFVLRGQIIGAGLALLCQGLVWPWAQSSAQMVWMLLPFALIGGLVFAHKRTAAGALDTNMAMFILLAPHFPDTVGMTQHASMALAVVAGPALAWVVYRMVYPTQAQVRMRHVARAMWLQIPQVASSAAAHAALDWQGQVHHRMLRLVRWADKTHSPWRMQLPEFGLTLHAVQNTVSMWRQWAASTSQPVPARVQRRLQVALQRLARWQLQSVEFDEYDALVRSWTALAMEPDVPPHLSHLAQRMAERDAPLLQQAKQVLLA